MSVGCVCFGGVRQNVREKRREEKRREEKRRGEETYGCTLPNVCAGGNH